MSENKSEFESALGAAKVSGRKFRIEHQCSRGESFVHYLTEKELAFYADCAAKERAEIERLASRPAAEKLARLGLTVEDIKAALAS